MSNTFRVLLLAVMCIPTVSLAQETRATVTGTVRDPQGARVPGVTVTVLNTDTTLRSRA